MMAVTSEERAPWNAGTFNALTISIDGHIAEITLSRPELLNRADAVLHEELPRAFQRLADKGDIRAVVLASSGKVFSDMAFTALLRRLKIPSTTPGKTATMHGFRSSFRDWASEETNTAHDTVEAALAHVRGDATVQAYARSDLFDKRSELMGKWARFVMGS